MGHTVSVTIVNSDDVVSVRNVRLDIVEDDAEDFAAQLDVPHASITIGARRGATMTIVETKGAGLRAALEMSLLLLRDDLAAAVESEAVPRDGDPDVASISGDGAAWIWPLVHAIREAERLVGRPDDGQPAWLDVIIDGTDTGRPEETA